MCIVCSRPLVPIPLDPNRSMYFPPPREPHTYTGSPACRAAPLGGRGVSTRSIKVLPPSLSWFLCETFFFFFFLFPPSSDPHGSRCGEGWRGIRGRRFWVAGEMGTGTTSGSLLLSSPAKPARPACVMLCYADFFFWTTHVTSLLILSFLPLFCFFFFLSFPLGIPVF